MRKVNDDGCQVMAKAHLAKGKGELKSGRNRFISELRTWITLYVHATQWQGLKKKSGSDQGQFHYSMITDAQ